MAIRLRTIILLANELLLLALIVRILGSDLIPKLTEAIFALGSFGTGDWELSGWPRTFGSPFARATARSRESRWLSEVL